MDLAVEGAVWPNPAIIGWSYAPPPAPAAPRAPAPRRRPRAPPTVLPVGFLLLGAGVLFGELGLDRTDKVSSAIGALTGLVGLLFSVPSLVKDRTEKPSAGQALPVQSRPAVIPARAVDSIPRDVADFVDREKALAKCEARAYGRLSAGVTACVISGMAGVGKTTLAVRAASRLASSYPDSRLFLNLHAYSRDRPPLSPGGALDALLRAFGVQPERIPATDEERAALWRTETRNSHTLILLDNVEGPEQIVPLLPASPTCMIIATSRRRIVLDGACTVFLDSLDTGNAVQLMEMVVGSGRIERDPRSITAVVGRCGGLPLALRLVAKHFECHPTWEPRHLLAELSDRQNRNILVASGHGGLVASFELSYEGLTSGQQRMLRRLALHPSHDFSIHAAVALSGGNADDARVVLDSLFDHSLVEEPQHGRYQIHDLVREFVKARTFVEDSAEEREEALNRLIDYYIAVTSRSEKMINLLGYRDKTDSLQWTPPEMPALASHEEAADWIETERPNLHACIQLADDIGQRTRAVRLARSMLYFLRLKGYWAEASELCVRSIEWCIELEDVACAADMRFLAGDIARLTGDQERALRFYGEALGGYQELGGRFLEARTQHTVGDLERTERRYDEALEVYSRARAGERGRGGGGAGARARRGGSDAHRLAHRTQEALANYETVLDIYQRLGDPVGQVRVLHSIGDIV